MKINFRLLIVAIAAVLALGGILVPSLPVHAAAKTATTTGVWSSTTTWGGTPPVAGDTVTINSGVTVTVDTNAACASITFITASTANGIAINTGCSLNVTGAITVPAPTGNVATTISVNGGTLTAGSVSLTAGTSSRLANLTVTTGTINVTGSITFGGTGTNARVSFTSAAGGTLNLGGNLGGGGTLTNNSGSYGTINCNGTAAQTIGGGSTSYSYNTLKINNPAGVTLGRAATIKTLTIGDIVDDSVFNDGGFTITPGTSSVLNLTSGTYNLSNTNPTVWPSWGTRNIAAGTTVGYTAGTGQTVSSTPAYQHLSLRGSGAKTITGVSSIGGNLTLGDTATVTLTSGMNIGGSLVLNTTSGTGVTISAGNTATVSGNVTGSGTLTLPGAATVNLGGNWAHSGTTTGAGLVLTCNGTGTQTISGTDTMSVTVNKAGGEVQLQNAKTIGTLLMTAGTFNPNNYLATISTLTFNGGTLKVPTTTWAGSYSATTTPAAGTTIEYSNSSATINGAITYQNLTYSGSGTAGASAALTVQGNLVNNGGGTLNFGANNVIISGAVVAQNIAGFTTTGSVSMTKTSGTATLTGNVNAGPLVINGAGGTLNLGSGLNHSVTNVTLTAGALNGGSSTLNVSGTWTGTSGFTAGAGTIAYTGLSAQTIAAVAYNNLTINNSNGVSINSNVTVNGILNLSSGKITTGASTLIISSTGSVSGGNSGSYVIGNLQKNVAAGSSVSRTFEVGGTNYNPVTLVFNSVSTAGNLVVKLNAGQHPNIGTSTISSSKNVNAYWSFTNSGIVFDYYGATLNFVAGDIIGGANPSDFIAGKYSGGWTYPAVGAKTSTSTQVTGLASLSDIALGETKALTLTYNAGANGSITGTTPQTVAYGGDGTQVTAVPDTGYHFTSWSDGVLTASRTELNVTADITVTANFAINTYTLDYAAGIHGSLSGSVSQIVNYNTSGTAVNANADTGYHFVQWSDGNTSNPRTDTNVAANVNVTASFAINSYTLTYTAGANGSITGSSPQTVTYGNSGTAVTAVPGIGYHFVDWSDSSTANPRTDTNVMANISVTANFAINTYTLTYSASANGTITGTTPQTVNHGSSGTEVTAVADTGCHFVSWSDGVLTANRTDTNITANLTVTASFAVNTYTLTYNAGANGSITGTSPQTVNYGASGSQVTASPNAGYHFVTWSDGVLTASRTDSNITANKNVTATFAINTYTLTYSAGLHGSITGASPQTVNHGASGTQVTAVSDSGYHFVSWNDGVLTASRTDTNVTGNINVTANFAADSTYTLSYFAGANGSITGSTPQSVTSGGSGTAVTAVPDTGYHFVQWSDLSTDNPRTDINVTADITVTASFAINTFTLTYNAGLHGSITGTTPQTVNYGASGTQVTAVADSGYHFVSWSDGVMTAARTDTNITANKSVTATFAMNSTHTITVAGDTGGTISPSGAVTVNDGDSQAFTFAASSGYYIGSIVIDGVSLGTIATDPYTYTFTNVTANHNIYVTFYTTSVSSSTGNTTVPAGQTDHVIDATATAGMTITLSTGAQPVGIEVIAYSGNPHPESTPPPHALPRYNDIVVSNHNTVVWPMHVEMQYTDGEIVSINETSLKMYYYQGASWHVCSSTGVDTANNIVWADLTSAEALGSPLSMGGDPLSGGPTSVGGEVFRVNKVMVLLPWIGIMAAIVILGSGTGYLVRKRRTIR